MQPSDAYSKIKVILNPIKIPSLPRSQHKITETENISTPFTCFSFFFSFTEELPTLFPPHPKQYPISSSFNPQIYFHKFPPWRKTISFVVQLEFPSPRPPKKISCTRSSPAQSWTQRKPPPEQRHAISRDRFRFENYLCSHSRAAREWNQLKGWKRGLESLVQVPLSSWRCTAFAVHSVNPKTRRVHVPLVARRSTKFRETVWMGRRAFSGQWLVIKIENGRISWIWSYATGNRYYLRKEK